jgi:hypothetical protein
MALINTSNQEVYTMKTFENLPSLFDYNEFLADHIAKHIDGADRNEPFMWSLGGDVNVIDTVKDYAKFLAGNDYFDISEDINDSWHMIVVINNNSGGPTYFIPLDIMEDYRSEAA